MKFRVRDYQTADSDKLEQLVEATFPDDSAMQAHAYFGEARTTPTYARTVVAVVADGPVGFASFYQNRLHYHPHDFRLSIVVSPEFGRRGVGRELYGGLLERLPSPVARLRALTPEHSGAAAFFNALGYRVLLRSYTPELNVQTVDLGAPLELLTALARSGYRFKTLAELDKTKVYDELTTLCLEAYADTHTHSPPLLSEDWASIFLGEDCLDEAFFVALKDDAMVGFSSLRPGERQGEMEAMWDGVARSERALAYPLRLALKLREVAYAKKNAVNNLVWEVDSVDWVGMQLLGALPFTVPPAHQLWIREVYPG